MAVAVRPSGRLAAVTGRRVLSWTVAVALAVGAVLVAWPRVHDAVVPPAVTLHDARPAGQVWTMPSDRVQAFLADRGLTAVVPAPPWPTSVVAHVTWVPRATSGDVRYVLVLGDEHGAAGHVDRVLGVPDADAGTAAGSALAPLMERAEWLRGNRPVEVDGGVVDRYAVASVGTGPGGEAWLVGHAVDVTGAVRDDPQPVVGVALVEGDRVRWLQRVAG